MIKMIIKNNNKKGFISTLNFKNMINLVSGFTLIELMIATTLFTIIMMMGVGSLVVSSNGAKSAQKLRISVDNVNFAMESMTREIRMGTHYNCVESNQYIISNVVVENDCENGGNVIEFNSPINQGETHRIAYYKVERTTPDGKGDGTYTLKRCESNTGECADIVSKDVNIDTLKFYVNGSTLPNADDTGDKIQPSVRILIRGKVVVKGIDKTFSLQTMASQRSTESTI